MSSFSSNGLYIYLYINTHPTQNLILAWQSQIKETIFFLNQWNELQTGYIDNAGYCTFCTVNCTVTMPCPSSNIPLRKSDTWDIHYLIHDLIHDTYFVNKIPIVWYHYYTCNVQIITLIAINYSFLFPFYFYFFVFCIAGGTWRFCVATSHFLVIARNTTGPGWPSVATAGTNMGWPIWYNYCICLVSLDHH